VCPAAWFSATELVDRVMSVGASLTSVTVIVNGLSNVRLPLSVERTRIA
jgi:hypothetical protein